MSENIVPKIDLSLFKEGNEDQRKEFINQLGFAFKKWGFVIVKNHGIPQNLIKRFYESSGDFFNLSDPIKRKYEIKGLAGQRGYTSFGKEHAKHSDIPDLKEFFQIGQAVDNDHPRKELYPDNIQVEEVNDFTKSGIELFKSFEETGAQLLKAIALFLKLPENYFDSEIKDGNSILRSIYYPPITREPDSAVRAEQHEDINLITLLVGASAGGLQLLNNDGKWLPVIPEEDEIAINVGDMLQRLTNDYLKSTTHRVINPPKEEWHIPRLSIPFFLHPVSDMDLTCLDQCVSDENPLKYEPISAGEYLDERLREIGLK
ncbi:isopenicillin N synthase family dioxygenase [Membranihabitans maritimus]|uniref:isopenicillin N synthase family dioxygenase n=1 Tax=Membranihabitans maritimus TaxID=2904244 RepID=UPI001F212BCC|nr:2-oxoglutarate and iron-dependent oxygenase domain-containing protein [Membranihabitans maritimus]